MWEAYVGKSARCEDVEGPCTNEVIRAHRRLVQHRRLLVLGRLMGPPINHVSPKSFAIIPAASPTAASLLADAQVTEPA